MRPAKIIHGKYGPIKLISKIGEGSFGTVWKSYPLFAVK
jgi:hypothetical protein